VIVVNKRKGETPLQVIKEIRNKDKNLNFLPMTYAGRLDPLAEGVLIILIGDEVYNKDEYLKLKKEYEVEILFGFATDTYDILGKVNRILELSDFSWSGTDPVPLVRGPEKFDNSRIRTILKNFTGYFDQKYPPYSSRTVSGKPLFLWAREGKLSEIEIPSHRVYVDSIEIINEKSYLGSELLSKIKNDISLVKGDFRQEEILKIWEEVLGNFPKENFQAITLRVSCGSGVYMRSLANDLGEIIGAPSLALNIKRTKIGDFNICSNL